MGISLPETNLNEQIQRKNPAINPCKPIWKTPKLASHSTLKMQIYSIQKELLRASVTQSAESKWTAERRNSKQGKQKFQAYRCISAGTATLVVREDNSGIEQRISLEIVEPEPSYYRIYNDSRICCYE